MIWHERELSQLPQKHGFRLRGLNMTRLETFSDAAFAASFVSIASLWIAHRKWRRRYGLEDMLSILISLSLIFIMLVYVYPLKMIFSAFFAWVSGGWLPTAFVLRSEKELVSLFMIYGLGFAAVMSMYALLYRRAMAAADQLRLNALEQLQTREDISLSLVLAVTGLASAGFAWLMPPDIGVFAGFVYMSLPLTMSFVATRYAKKARGLESA